jgi:hypothetical protein
MPKTGMPVNIASGQKQETVMRCLDTRTSDVSYIYEQERHICTHTHTHTPVANAAYTLSLGVTPPPPTCISADAEARFKRALSALRVEGGHSPPPHSPSSRRTSRRV